MIFRQIYCETIKALKFKSNFRKNFNPMCQKSFFPLKKIHLKCISPFPEVFNKFLQTSNLGLENKIFHSRSTTFSISFVSCWGIWQHGLWSFQTGGIRLERFLSKNQHSQRKLLTFENWVNGEVSNNGHHFRKWSDLELMLSKNVSNKKCQ